MFITSVTKLDPSQCLTSKRVGEAEVMPLKKAVTAKNPAKKRKSCYKKWKAKRPEGMPARPLSAYNLFFREERELIVQERTEQLQEEARQKAAAKGEPFLPQKIKQAKISFEELAKIVGARWKNISHQEKERLQVMAELDALRYKREMDIFLKKGDDNLKTELAAKVEDTTFFARQEEPRNTYLDHGMSSRLSSTDPYYNALSTLPRSFGNFQHVPGPFLHSGFAENKKYPFRRPDEQETHGTQTPLPFANHQESARHWDPNQRASSMVYHHTPVDPDPAEAAWTQEHDDNQFLSNHGYSFNYGSHYSMGRAYPVVSYLGGYSGWENATHLEQCDVCPVRPDEELSYQAKTATHANVDFGLAVDSYQSLQLFEGDNDRDFFSFRASTFFEGVPTVYDSCSVNLPLSPEKKEPKLFLHDMVCVFDDLEPEKTFCSIDNVFDEDLLSEMENILDK